MSHIMDAFRVRVSRSPLGHLMGRDFSSRVGVLTVFGLATFFGRPADAQVAQVADEAAPPPPPPAPPAMPALPSAQKAAKADGKPDERAEEARPKNVPVKASPKRELPNYDGRGPKPTTLGQDLLWVPRLIVSPVYLTTEYVIRRPIGTLVAAAERSNVPQELYDFFLFGPDHKIGVIPTIYFDFGFSPSVGLFGFWNDAGWKGNDLSAHFSIWTSDWIAGSVGDSIAFGHKNHFSVKAGAIKRPDRAYFGPGPDSLQQNRSRYGETRLEGSAAFDIPLWRSSELSAGGGFRSDDIYHGNYDNDFSVEQQADAGVYPLPYGFGRGYSEEFNHALLALDTRKAGTGSGIRLEAQGEQGNDVRHAPDSAWIRYQGTAGIFYDLNRRGRILSLTGTALFADPLERGGQIPFTELVSLGGNVPVLSAMATGVGLMPGFYTGRLVDRSAAVATLQYRWPIWAWLDGTLQVATGNVFGDHLDEFKMSLLRFSGALGIESIGVSQNAIHLLIGIGSETIEHGGQVDSVRLAFGTSRF